MRKIKRCELQFPVSQETLGRFQITLAQSQDKIKSLYAVVYVSEKPNIEDRALIDKTKKMLLEVLSNPKAIVRTEQVEELTTDASFHSVATIDEKVYDEVE